MAHTDTLPTHQNAPNGAADTSARSEIESSVAPEHIDRLCAIALNLADTAEKRQADAVSERRAQDELIAEIAHDLRQPLSLISIIGELLVLDDSQHRHYHRDMLRQAVQTMKNLIDNLLEREPAASSNVQPTDPAALVREVIRELTPLAAQHQLLIEGSVEEGLPMIYCDPAKVQRVYSNLMGNAIRFAAPLTVIRLASRRVADGVQFSVTNDGPVIPALDVTHVFERRWQACDHGEGRGLGLTIAKKIIEEQGGSIGVLSEAGATSFCFTLPLRRAEMTMTPGQSDSQPA